MVAPGLDAGVALQLSNLQELDLPGVPRVLGPLS